MKTNLNVNKEASIVDVEFEVADKKVKFGAIAISGGSFKQQREPCQPRFKREWLGKSASARHRGGASDSGRVNLTGGDVILNGSRYVLTGGTSQFVNRHKPSPL